MKTNSERALLDNRIKKLEAQLRIAKNALLSTGKNTCGCEPLAAAYARGILVEMAEGVR